MKLHLFYKNIYGLVAVLTLFGLAFTACQPQESVPVTGPTAPTTMAQVSPTMASTPSSTAEAVLTVATDPKFGKILVGNNGMTLYMYTTDGPNQSNCSGGCLTYWPPLLTHGNPVLGDGVDKSMVGTASLADGSKIVTYNKMPLYYWKKDTKPGDVTGQNVDKAWFVVSPDGKVVKDAPASAAEPAASGEAVLNVVSDAKYGKILVGANGKTLYIYTSDGPNQSTCMGGCAKAWPPLLTQGNPTLGDGVDKSLVGFATLADGSKIVTYNKMPLYYWMKDTKAGDTTGQNVGKVWFVISPSGTPVKM